MLSGKDVTLREGKTTSATGVFSAHQSALFNSAGTRLMLAGSGSPEPAVQALTCVDAATGGDLFTIQGATAPVALSADSRRIAAADLGSNSGDGRIFDATDGRELARLRGHTGPIVALAFTPDGGRIASTSRDGTVKVWDANNGRELLTIAETDRPAEHLRFSADGSRLVVVDDEGRVRIWESHPSP